MDILYDDFLFFGTFEFSVFVNIFKISSNTRRYVHLFLIYFFIMNVYLVTHGAIVVMLLLLGMTFSSWTTKILNNVSLHHTHLFKSHEKGTILFMDLILSIKL